MIEAGREWQIRELSEAALEVAEEVAGMVSQEAIDAAYAQGVGEVLRMLIADDGDAARRDSEDVLTRIYERYLEGV